MKKLGVILGVVVICLGFSVEGFSFFGGDNWLGSGKPTMPVFTPQDFSFLPSNKEPIVELEGIEDVSLKDNFSDWWQEEQEKNAEMFRNKEEFLSELQKLKDWYQEKKTEILEKYDSGRAKIELQVLKEQYKTIAEKLWNQHKPQSMIIPGGGGLAIYAEAIEYVPIVKAKEWVFDPEAEIPEEDNNPMIFIMTKIEVIYDKFIEGIGYVPGWIPIPKENE